MDFNAAVLIQLFFAFTLTLGALLLSAPLAPPLGLTDKPNHRKTHKGHIPLMGGIAIYLSVAVLLILNQPLDARLSFYLLGAGLLVLEGILDDRFNLNVKLRIGLEIIAGAVMVFGADLWIGNLGDLLGLGPLHMPLWIAVPFTLVAVFGIINAINMLDGFDGLAAGFSMIAIAVLMMAAGNSPTLQAVGPLLVGALAAFLLFNLKPTPYIPKIFLGDAGSKLLGFTLVWLLIEVARQGGQATGGLEPVTALYIVGLPLIDMVTTTVRRVRKGVSPFYPDRTHIHHVLQRAGFRRETIIFSILALSLAINLLGIGLQAADCPEVLQFALFFGLYYLYAYNIRHAWKLSRWLRQQSADGRQSS